MTRIILHILLLLFSAIPARAQQQWQSRYVQYSNGKLTYVADEKGNRIPDFSRVGYAEGSRPIPYVTVVKTVAPSDTNSMAVIQSAIDEVSAMPMDKNGFRGTVLLKKGVYKIPGTISIAASGIVLRGEGDGTVLVATGRGQRSLIWINGKGKIEENGSRTRISNAYVPVGASSFNVTHAKGYKAGDSIIVFRPGTASWIRDLRMDRIDARDSTRQWEPAEYNLHYERVITRIEGSKIYIDNPVVMAMDEDYGGGEIFHYSFSGRIKNVGVENLVCLSEFTSDTDEDHAWNAVMVSRAENGWVKHVTARHFGYSCVNLGGGARNFTVDSCRYIEPKSQVTGGRRYSFNNDGQLNLVKNCFASEGRHDYVTGAKVCGPNVFYNCVSVNARADIGPHHRWATGTLYDHIVTDGEINVQDRGNWGTGHGWAGANQVIWNCVAARAAIQDPWVSAKNYVVGLKAAPVTGRLKGRPASYWDGKDGGGLVPASLYLAQLKNK